MSIYFCYFVLFLLNEQSHLIPWTKIDLCERRMRKTSSPFVQRALIIFNYFIDEIDWNRAKSADEQATGLRFYTRLLFSRPSRYCSDGLLMHIHISNRTTKLWGYCTPAINLSRHRLNSTYHPSSKSVFSIEEEIITLKRHDQQNPPMVVICIASGSPIHKNNTIHQCFTNILPNA
jgi:hypothetical protein